MEIGCDGVRVRMGKVRWGYDGESWVGLVRVGLGRI